MNNQNNNVVRQIQLSLNRNPFIQYKLNQIRYFRYLINEQKKNKPANPYTGYYRIKNPLKVITYP